MHLFSKIYMALLAIQEINYLRYIEQFYIVMFCECAYVCMCMIQIHTHTYTQRKWIISRINAVLIWRIWRWEVWAQFLTMRVTEFLENISKMAVLHPLTWNEHYWIQVHLLHTMPCHCTLNYSMLNKPHQIINSGLHTTVADFTEPSQPNASHLGSDIA